MPDFHQNRDRLMWGVCLWCEQGYERTGSGHAVHRETLRLHVSAAADHVCGWSSWTHAGVRWDARFNALSVSKLVVIIVSSASRLYFRCWSSTERRQNSSRATGQILREGLILLTDSFHVSQLLNSCIDGVIVSLISRLCFRWWTSTSKTIGSTSCPPPFDRSAAAATPPIKRRRWWPGDVSHALSTTEVTIKPHLLCSSVCKNKMQECRNRSVFYAEYFRFSHAGVLQFLNTLVLWFILLWFGICLPLPLHPDVFSLLWLSACSAN